MSKGRFVRGHFRQGKAVKPYVVGLVPKAAAKMTPRERVGRDVPTFRLPERALSIEPGAVR